VAVLSRNDLVDQPAIFPYFGPVIRDQPVVAIDKVRFVGDPVAAVAAVDEDDAREALDLIEVEYEELPAVFDPEEALLPTAPVLHESFPRVASGIADTILHTEEGTNRCNHFKLRKGDVEQGFREADQIFEHTFRSPPVQHVPLESHAAIAQVEAGRITLWAGTRTPHHTRAQLAEMFGVPLSNVRVVVHALGGAYGAKCYPKIEPITAASAWKTGRPIKLVLSRGVTIHLETGFERDGPLLLQRRCLGRRLSAPDQERRLRHGRPVPIPHVKVDSYAVYTNTVPAGAFRGYGISQAAWAYESRMDIIVEALGIDAQALRLKNVLRDGDAFATGETAHE